MKNISWAEHKKELLKDKNLKRELTRLEPEFQLAEQIIGLRVKHKLTQTELAVLAKTSQIVISRLENGRANPSLALIKRIFNAFGKEIKITAV